MCKKDYRESESEKEINKVLKFQDDQLKGIQSVMNSNDQKLDESIHMAEQALLSFGKGSEIVRAKNTIHNQPVIRYQGDGSCGWQRPGLSPRIMQ